MSAVADCKHGKPVTLCTRCLAPRPTWRPSRKAVEIAARLIGSYAYWGAIYPKPQFMRAMRRALLAAWKIDHPTEGR